MGSTTVCGEHQHKFHHSHQPYLNKKSLREIDIPPRKLLSRRSAVSHPPMSDVFSDSPKGEDALLSKFLPCNTVDDDDSDPYSSDQFRIYEFKVRKCNRTRSHDWTDCPFAHPGEKARRRDPRRFLYSGTVCSEFRKGYCSKGDNCEFSHGVFECWLHPSRYRTEACKDGKNCKRKICFFAHSTKQLRISPDPSSPPPMRSPTEDKMYRNVNHCCVFCHASPTSPLMGMPHLSPPFSPPLSPAVNAPEFSRLSSMESCGFPEFSNGGMTYKDALTELMCSMESMHMNEAPVSHSATFGNGTRRNLPWLDVNNFSVDVEQPQFVLSPSTPSPGTSKFFTGESSKLFIGNFSGENLMEEYNRYNHESNLQGGPDLGWVNDLLT